jgi:hypothetical protein
MARVLRGPVPGGRDGGQLVTGGARGHAWPAARRGRWRTKAERADRQRRFPRGRTAPARPERSVHSPDRCAAAHSGTTRAARRTARSARP